MKNPILCCVALILLLVACAPATEPLAPTATPLPQSTPLPDVTPINGEPAPDASPTPTAPPLPTSEDLIAQALATGEIDYESSLLYRTFAIFGDPQLPEEFLSPIINIDAGTALFSEIFANQEQLSAETLEALAPFMARANDPVSIFNQEASSMRIGLSAPSKVATWQSMAAAEGSVRVWVRSADPQEADFLLAGYAEAVNEIWPHLRDLIDLPWPDEPNNPSAEINPDRAVDIYFVSWNLSPRLEQCLKRYEARDCRVAGVSGLTIEADLF